MTGLDIYQIDWKCDEEIVGRAELAKKARKNEIRGDIKFSNGSNKNPNLEPN